MKGWKRTERGNRPLFWRSVQAAPPGYARSAPMGGRTGRYAPAGGWPSPARSQRSARIASTQTKYSTALVALFLLLLAPLAWGDTEDRRPDGQVASDGNSCAALAHMSLDDDVDAPGGDWCTALVCGGGGTSSPVWHLNLQTPTGPPTTGTDEQVMAARVRLCGSATSTPTCRLDAYCGGALVATGAEQNVTSATGQTLTQSWTFSTGSCAADGSDVEVRLTCTSSGGNPGNRRTGDADAVEWRANYSTGPAPRGAIIVSR